MKNPTLNYMTSGAKLLVFIMDSPKPGLGFFITVASAATNMEINFCSSIPRI